MGCLYKLIIRINCCTAVLCVVCKDRLLEHRLQAWIYIMHSITQKMPQMIETTRTRRLDYKDDLVDPLDHQQFYSEEPDRQQQLAFIRKPLSCDRFREISIAKIWLPEANGIECCHQISTIHCSGYSDGKQTMLYQWCWTLYSRAHIIRLHITWAN